MARVLGVIAEYNPFHHGHSYHLQESIKQAETDYTVAVISGNFVQRGNPSVINKWQKTKMALQSGIDLVIELPTIYSVSSAENFAHGAVQILESLKIVNTLSFGTETDDLAGLNNIANLLTNEPKEYTTILHEELKKGNSFPKARQTAVLKILNDNRRYTGLLTSPNNILAIEYLRHTSLPAKAVRRIGKGHDTNDELYSASAIRKKLNQGEICTIKNCEKAILARLRAMSSEDFAQIEDVNEGLENRIYNAVRQSASVEDIYKLIKTKRYTLSRIRRIILKAYLGITKEYSFDVPYIRILGFNSKGKELLPILKKNAKLPIISKYSDIQRLDNNGKKLFELECRCTDLYNLGYKNPLPCGTEQRSKLIIKD